MSDDADKNLNQPENNEEDLNLLELNKIKIDTKEVLSVFKVEADKYLELLKYYQTEKDYKAEIEKVLKELMAISGELDAADIQQEKDFIVERIRIWNERLDKAQDHLDDLNDEIQKSLVGKWLEQAAKEVDAEAKKEKMAEPAKKIELPKQEPAKKEPVKVEPKEVKVERTAEPVEFDFDMETGLLKLPSGVAVDISPAKGHCYLNASEEDKNQLADFEIQSKKPNWAIKIKVDNSIVKILEITGKNEQVLIFDKPAEAKDFIERFIRQEIVAPEVKPAAVEAPKKVEEPVKPKETLKPAELRPKGIPSGPKAGGRPMSWQEQLAATRAKQEEDLAAVRAKILAIPAKPEAVQPPVVKAEEKVEKPAEPVKSPEIIKAEKPVEEIKPVEIKVEKIVEPVKPPEIEKKKEILEEIEMPKNVDTAAIAKFFRERQDDTAWNNYDSIARELEQLNEKNKAEDKYSVIQRTMEMLEQRLTVALTLKDSKDAEKARKWRIEEVTIGAYKEFLQKSLETLSAEAPPVVQETELEIPVEVVEPETPVVSETAATVEEVEIPIEEEIMTELKERNKLIEELKNQLDEVRKNLVTALANRERAGGVFGSLKTWLGSTREEVAEIEYDNAWEVYERVQKELMAATEAQADSLKNFLDGESKNLQEKIGEHYKGKENIVAKVWKRLGEMNLYNYLEKKNKEVIGREKSGEIVRGWDKFWANRGAELSQSHLWAKIGARALSVRLGISLGLLGVGLYEVPGLVTSNIYIGVRTAFVGTGAVFGSRAASDTLQNIGQRWLGKRKEVFSTREEAEIVWRNRLGLAEEATGGDLELPSGGESAEKTDKRHKKLAKAMEKVEATISLIMDLKPEDRLKEIQHRVAAIEAYAYVNGFDLDKDENYQRLTHFRDRTIQEILKDRAKELGDVRETIRPDSLVDALAYLESRKQELNILGGKISGEKQLRWGKRIVSTVIGAAAGYLAYVNMMGKAAAVEIEHQQAVAGGKIIGGGAAAGETKTITDELIDKYHYPAEGLPESTQEQVKELLNGWEQRGLSARAIANLANNGLTEGEITDINRLLSGVAGHREALAAISRTLEEGADSSGVLKSMLVQTARGSNSIEGLLQKQLKINPEAFGYDSKSGVSVEKWADHQASLLAKEQHLDDKYFVFNKNKDQFVILRPDGKIELVGKTYVIEHAEVEPIKVVSEHKMNTRILDKYLEAEAAGDTATTEQMLERYSEHFTDQEKVWLDQHWQTNEAGQKFLSPKDIETLRQIWSHGHVYEDAETGKQYHADELDIGQPAVASGLRTTDYSPVGDIPKGGGHQQSDEVLSQPVKAPTVPLETSSAETATVLGPAHPEYIFRKGDLSANLRFEYGVGGKVVGYDGDFRGFSDSQAYTNFYRTDYVREIEDVRPLLRAKNFILGKDGELLNDLKARGLESSSEADFLKERIRRTLENVSQIKHSQVQNLFKQDKLVEFGFEEKK